MTATKPSRIVAAIEANHCDNCDMASVVLFQHTTIDRNGDVARWDFCGHCEFERRQEQAQERAALEAVRPELESILAKWDKMDTHEAYEALQALSMQVLLA